MAASILVDIEKEELAPRIKHRGSIKAELKAYNLPLEIIEGAEAYFQQHFSGDTHRATNRRQIAYFCVNSIYNSRGIPCDPHTLGSMMGLKKGEVQGAITLGSKLCKPVKRFTTPDKFIPIYCDTLGLELSLTREITEFSVSLLEKHPEFREMFPQTVAAGAIYYYCQTRGVKFQDFAARLGNVVTSNTIIACSSKIADAHNNDDD